MKECSKCIEIKSTDNFNKRKVSKDGLRSECRECQRKQMREYRKRNPDRDMRYYEANKEDINKRRKQVYRDTKEAILERNKRYREHNKETVALTNARWRENNPDKMRGYRRNYKERNRDKIRVSENNREATKRSLISTLTDSELSLILKNFNHKCVICGDDFDHLDHFIPLSSSHGGTSEENIVPKCARCNISKRDKNPFEWAESLEDVHKTNFEIVVEYLAELNGLTVDEYREFVFWCFENRREVDEITDENRDSLELWLRTREVA